MSRISVKIAADTSELVKLQTEAQRFSARFKQAFAFSAGASAFAALAVSVAKIKEGFEETLKTGVAFNAKMESAQLSVAAIFKQFAPSRFKTFDAALRGADNAVNELRKKAATTNATFEDLLSSYQSTAGQLFAAGISDAKKQIDTIALLANAVKAIISDKGQLVQETRAILTGNITEDATAARTFGITRQAIEKAKEQGRLYEFLKEKVGNFGEAGERAAETFDGALDNLKDQWLGLAQEFTQPIFEDLKASIKSTAQTIQSVEFRSAIRPFFEDATKVVKVFTSLTKFALDNAQAISEITRVLATLGIAYKGLKIAEWIVTLGREIAARQSNVSAIAAETAAIEANTAAKVRNVAASGATAASTTGAALAGAVGALTAGGISALPPSGSIVPRGGGGGMRPLLGGGRTFVDIEAEVMSTTYKARTATQAAAQAATGVAKAATTMLARIGSTLSMVGNNPLLVAGAAVGGWQIGKMLRRPIYGHNGEEDLNRLDDINDRWNEKLTGFHDQAKSVTSVQERKKLLTDLENARMEIEKQIPEEGSLTIRNALRKQLRDVDAYSASGARISPTMMAANRTRMAEEAAKNRKIGERDQNAANYEEGLQKWAASTTTGQIAQLEKTIAKTGDGRSLEELRARYSQLQKAVAAAQNGTDKDAITRLKAEAEATRKTIEQVAELKRLKEEMAEAERARRVSEDAVAIRAAESRGAFGQAESIRQRQEREDFVQQLRKQNEELAKQGRLTMDINAIMARYDVATANGRARARRRAEDEVSIREMESRGDFAGAGKLRRRNESEDYADNLRRQGFNEADVIALQKRQDAISAQDQARGLRRFNLEQRVMELRAAGKEQDAQALDFVLKREEMSERIQREFGLNAKAATALAEKRLGAELSLERGGVSASAIQRIGGGGGAAGGGREQTRLLRDIKERLDRIVVQGGRKDTSWGSEFGQF